MADWSSVMWTVLTTTLSAGLAGPYARPAVNPCEPTAVKHSTVAILTVRTRAAAPAPAPAHEGRGLARRRGQRHERPAREAPRAGGAAGDPGGTARHGSTPAPGTRDAERGHRRINGEGQGHRNTAAGRRGDHGDLGGACRSDVAGVDRCLKLGAAHEGRRPGGPVPLHDRRCREATTADC